MKLDRIICGDNVETMDGFPDDSIDLVVTSPPYDNLRTYGTNGDMSELWNFEALAAQLWRVIKPGGVVVWVVGDATIDGSETGTSFRQALHFKEIGFRLHDTMIYRKKNPIPLSHNRYEQEFEYIFIFSNGKPKTFNPIMKENKTKGKTVNWSSPEVSANAARRSRFEKTKTAEKSQHGNIFEYVLAEDKIGKHPAPFPSKLARDHILSWSNEGDIVLDPFSGSGTTAKMAKHNGRRYVGIEINPEYCEIAEKRLEQNVLFGLDDGNQ